MTKRILVVIFTVLVSVKPLCAANVTIQNINSTANAGYGLFTSNGVLVDGAMLGNLRLGFFSINDAAILAAWNVGDLVTLNSNFTNFSTPFGMEDFDSGVNGIFQANLSEFSDPYAGNSVYLYASNSSDFLNANGEFLIYKFSTQFQIEPWGPIELILGESAGALIIGGFNNFSFDYGLGGGPLPGFNTAAAVPEPSSALLLGLGAAGLYLLRRRKAKA